MQIEAVSAEDVRPLRHAVLRPGQPAESAIFAGDESPGTLHVAARVDGQIASVGSILREPYPDGAGADDWRLRGMATTPALRGQGLASAVLGRCIEHVTSNGGSRVWCAARPAATQLYERFGFKVARSDFEVHGIGAHQLMSRELP